MKLDKIVGSTSQTINVFIQDSTSSTGAGKTGLAFNTASLVAYYVREKTTATAITLATQTVTGAFSSGGFVEIDATNMPGWYRLDPPNACFNAGSASVGIMLKGATGMAPLSAEIQLVAYNPQDAAALGLTNLDALISSRMASGTVTVGTNNDKTGYSLSASQTYNLTGNVTGNLSGSVGSVTGNVTGSVGSVVGSVTVGTNSDKSGYTLSSGGIQAIWDALTSALTTVGSIGKRLADNIDVVISTRGTSTLTTTDVQNSVSSELDRSVTELASVPGSTSSMRDRVKWLFEYFKNKRTLTSSVETLFKDDSATSLGTSTVSDDGTTFTKGKMA